METINFEIFELSREKDIVQIAGQVDLHENYLFFNMEYSSRVEDEIEGWKDQQIHWKAVLLKDAIVSIDKYFNDKEDIWHVEVETDGRSRMLQINFQTEAKAELFFNKIFKWRFE